MTSLCGGIAGVLGLLRGPLWRAVDNTLLQARPWLAPSPRYRPFSWVLAEHAEVLHSAIIGELQEWLENCVGDSAQGTDGNGSFALICMSVAVNGAHPQSQRAYAAYLWRAACALARLQNLRSRLTIVPASASVSAGPS